MSEAPNIHSPIPQPPLPQPPIPQPMVQLRLLTGGSGARGDDWTLDERTRTVGREGVAVARAILRQAQPPQPRESYAQAS